MTIIRYKAAIATSERTVRIETVTRSVSPDCELLRVVGCFVCGSDLQNISSNRYIDQTPGHEIVALRANHPRQGLVTVFPIIPCHKCSECLVGEFRDCESKKSVGSELPGGFAEYIQVPSWNVIPIQGSLSEHSVGLIEPLAVGLRLLFDIQTRLNASDNILIIGDGPVGILDYRVLTKLGNYNVTLFGKYRQRLAYLDNESSFKVAEEVTGQDFEFADAIIICSKSENFILQYINFIKPGTRIFLQTRITDLSRQLIKDRDIYLDRGFAYRYEDFVSAQELLLNSWIRVDDLVSQELPLAMLPDFLSGQLKKSEFMKVFIRLFYL